MKNSLSTDDATFLEMHQAELELFGKEADHTDEADNAYCYHLMLTEYIFRAAYGICNELNLKLVKGALLSLKSGLDSMWLELDKMSDEEISSNLADAGCVLSMTQLIEDMSLVRLKSEVKMKLSDLVDTFERA